MFFLLLTCTVRRFRTFGRLHLDNASERTDALLFERTPGLDFRTTWDYFYSTPIHTYHHVGKTRSIISLWWWQGGGGEWQWMTIGFWKSFRACLTNSDVRTVSWVDVFVGVTVTDLQHDRDFGLLPLGRAALSSMKSTRWHGNNEPVSSNYYFYTTKTSGLKFYRVKFQAWVKIGGSFFTLLCFAFYSYHHSGSHTAVR